MSKTSYAAAVLMSDLDGDADPAIAARLVASLQMSGFPVLPRTVEGVVAMLPGAETDRAKVNAITNLLFSSPDLLNQARTRAMSMLLQHADQLDKDTLAEIDAGMRIAVRKPTPHLI